MSLGYLLFSIYFLIVLLIYLGIKPYLMAKYQINQLNIRDNFFYDSMTDPVGSIIISLFWPLAIIFCCLYLPFKLINNLEELLEKKWIEKFNLDKVPLPGIDQVNSDYRNVEYQNDKSAVIGTIVSADVPEESDKMEWFPKLQKYSE